MYHEGTDIRGKKAIAGKNKQKCKQTTQKEKVKIQIWKMSVPVRNCEPTVSGAHTPSDFLMKVNKLIITQSRSIWAPSDTMNLVGTEMTVISKVLTNAPNRLHEKFNGEALRWHEVSLASLPGPSSPVWCDDEVQIDKRVLS